MPVILKTDALLFLLLGVVWGYVWYARRHEHLRAPWRQVARQPRGMAAAVILLAFVAVAVLDSLHFRPAAAQPGTVAEGGVEVMSLFDVLVSKLRVQRERTYSAPFAAYAFTKETLDAVGQPVRDYPRLIYGGAHLVEPESDRLADIAMRGGYGALGALLVWLIICGLLCAHRARTTGTSLGVAFGDIRAGRTAMPWRVILFALALQLSAIGICAALAPYYHVLGTDKVGNDVLYQALKSIRTGLLIGTLTTLVMLPFAIVLGVAAGYFRGWVDDVIQYLYTTLSSIPGVLLIAAAALMLEVYMVNHAAEYAGLAVRADLRLLALCLILGVTTWSTLCRYLRGETLKLREVEFVQAARAFGVGPWAILARHIIPNTMHIVMISIVLDFSGLVLAEAALSYIDIGVDPSMESWGNMINGARLELARDPVVWWSLGAAFAFMFTLVLAANIFADAVRDAFDPRIRDMSE